MKHILLIQNYRRCDLLQSTPAIAALRRSRPEAHIAVLVRKPAADTLRGNTDVDEIIEWDTDPLVVAPEEDPRKLARAKESLSEFIHKLRARNFDAVYNFSNDLPCALLAYLLNPRKYAGLAYCDDRRYRVRNEWIRYLFLAAELRGMNTLNFADVLMEACAASEELAPRIFGGPEDERFAEQTIAAAFGHTARPVAIGIPPPEEARFWPLKRFIEVAAALQLSGAEILLLGPDAQQHTAEQLAGSLPNPARALNLAGKASLHKTAALLKRCKYLVAADSVTPQVAAATYTPSLLTCYGALYAGDIGPYGDGHYILEPASRCFPCASHYQCRTMHCRLSTGSIIPKRLRAENLVLSRSTWMPDGLLGLQPLNRPPISIQPLLRMIFRTCSLACRLPLIRPKARSLWRPWRKEIFRWYRLRPIGTSSPNSCAASSWLAANSKTSSKQPKPALISVSVSCDVQLSKPTAPTRLSSRSSISSNDVCWTSKNRMSRDFWSPDSATPCATPTTCPSTRPWPFAGRSADVSAMHVGSHHRLSGNSHERRSITPAATAIPILSSQK